MRPPIFFGNGGATIASVVACALATDIGSAYREYMQRTSRLIPFVI